MSIVDKLTYLNTTKQLLKTEINKINNVLDDNSTFRSYPQELFNGYLDILNNGTDTLWNNLEKVSQTGTEAALEGVETAPMKIELSGNTSQETTTGKNLLPTQENEWEQGGILITGQNKSDTTRLRTKQYYPISNDTNYHISVQNTNYCFLNLLFYDNNKNFVGNYYDAVSNQINGATDFTINIPSASISNVAYARATIRNADNSTINANEITTIKPQLELGSTATSWEKYTGGQPSPSPDYPQEVKVVKGNNVVSVSGENQSDKTDYPLSLGDIELCKIGNYQDYLYKNNGSWYVHKEIGKKVVDENSSVAAYSVPRFRVYVANFVSPSATEKADILCDKLRTVTKNALASADNVISGSDNGRTGEMLVRINAEINTLDLFKQFLAENNLTIYYVLATPTEEEITNTTLIEQLEAISKAKSVKDKTYITQTNDDLPFILDVEAIKEYSVE